MAPAHVPFSDLAAMTRDVRRDVDAEDLAAC